MSYSTTVWYWLRHQELAPTVETISQKLFLGRNTYRLDSLQRDHVTQICVSWSRRCNSGFRKYTDAPCTRLWFVNSSIELIFLHLLRTPCQMWPNNRNITIWTLTHYRVLWCHTRDVTSLPFILEVLWTNAFQSKAFRSITTFIVLAVEGRYHYIVFSKCKPVGVE